MKNRTQVFCVIKGMAGVSVVRKSDILGYLGDANIDLGDFVPGGVVGDAGNGQVEDLLKASDGIGSGRSIDAIGGNSWYGWIILCDTI